MSKPLTVIGKARELQSTHGKEYALKFFKEKRKETTDVFMMSGYDTAIEWLEIGDDGMRKKAEEFIKSIKNI